MKRFFLFSFCIIYCIVTAATVSEKKRVFVQPIFPEHYVSQLTEQELILGANFSHLSLQMEQRRISFYKEYNRFLEQLKDFNHQQTKHLLHYETLTLLTDSFNSMIKTYFEYIKLFITWKHCTDYTEKHTTPALERWLTTTQNLGKERIVLFCKDYFPQIQDIMIAVQEDADRRGKHFFSVAHTIKTLADDSFPFEQMDTEFKEIARFDILTYITHLSAEEAFKIFEANQLLTEQINAISDCSMDFFISIYAAINKELDKREVPDHMRKLLFSHEGLIALSEQQEALPS